MTFGHVKCDRCGKIMDVENIDYHNDKIVCPDCAKLQTGGICRECKHYCLLTGVCGAERSPKHAIKDEDAKCNNIWVIYKVEG